MIRRSGLTQKEAAAKWFPFGAGRLSQKLNEMIWDVEELEHLSSRTGYTLEWIRYGTGAEKNQDPELNLNDPDNSEYLSGKLIRPITVTVDRAGKELITYVPVKAQAGYRIGFGDNDYISTLPAFSMPTFQDGTYRMFQVKGESMLQPGGGGLHDGDIVITQYVDDVFSMKDNRVYVIVCKGQDEGVIVKRILNRLTTEGKFLLAKSDNEDKDRFPDKMIHAREILEVWELKAFISRQLGYSTDIWKKINDLETNQAQIKEKLNELAKSASVKELPIDKNKRTG